MTHHWPGNVRELRNVLEATVAMGDGTAIEPAHLPDRLRECEREAAAAPTTLRGLEHAALRSYAATHPGTRRDLARVLGVSERTLYRRLRAR